MPHMKSTSSILHVKQIQALIQQQKELSPKAHIYPTMSVF